MASWSAQQSTMVSAIQRAPSDPDVEGLGFEPHAELRRSNLTMTVEVYRDRLGEVELGGAGASHRDLGVGDVGAAPESRSGLQTVAYREIGIEQIETAIAGMGPRSNVPGAYEGRVGGDEYSASKPGLSGYEMGHEPMELAVEERLAEVDGDMGGLGGGFESRAVRPPEGAVEITTGETDPRYRGVGPASRGDHIGGGTIRIRVDQI